ncbi:hypothetical protein NUU61_006798 [Penicillium alfredii]|uniref:Uncharacterized protein n=1 Tax=Penicillium alfredii TaxID=1506179 RepID=A0A9W9F1H3_9EURO|nr:uncharacterized protein NUU61_006798 [Penicillium alfredii]KAJ5091928.1 hypothetical protein NUU61_006798 [Penicillium alfredii]
MARRYEIEELLWLRSSPLVAKPPGLPPIEEWMPQPDPTTQRKQQNPRDHNNPSETSTNRRPSFFEARHISRGSNSEDIILGPPKTAFASSRIGGKGSSDLTDRSSRPHDSDDPKNDRFNFRDRFFKDRDAPERDIDRRDGRPGPLNGRRGEKEDWNAGRPRRTFGPDDPDRKPRRNGEFDRWDSRDQHNERGARDKEGRFLRKDGQPGRTKYDGSWFRDENTHDGQDADDDKPPLRNREWRRDRHGADRDWNRGAKFEQEPEWLDTNDRDEPRRAHTQEDFERWKERMKAGSSAAPPQAQAHAEEKSASVSNTASQKLETRRTDGEIFSSGPSLMADTSMERFFGLLGDTKPPVPDIGTPTPVDSAAKKEVLPGKPGKSSRFAGLFSPPPESSTREPELNAGPKPPPIDMPAPPSANPQDADQEGFQRILQMLGGGRSNNATPHQADVPQQSRPSSFAQPEQPRAVPALSPPAREPPSRQDYMGSAPEALLTQAGKDPQARERDHLLRLMQQVRVGPSPPDNPALQSPGAGPAPPPGLMPEVLTRPPGLPAQKAPNFLDDPAIANMQRPDSEQLRRRAANGPPMGYFDDIPFPQGNRGPITPGGSRPIQAPTQPPMGLQRPPGLENIPPPGWTGHPVPQQGNGPSPMGPPPGIPTPNRGMNPNFPPGMLPLPGNAPPLSERQAFPRGPPPGMMPPPGYMNAPPPPGFPPMPPNPEAMLGLGPGSQGPFGPGNPGSQGPPPSSRHLLEMFGQSNGGDARGGMVGPGQFR